MQIEFPADHLPGLMVGDGVIEAIEQVEISDGDGDHLVELGMVFGAGDLVHIGLGGVVLNALEEGPGFAHLHFDDIADATMIQTADIQYRFLHAADTRGQKGIENGHLADAAVTGQTHQAFQKADENILGIVAAENFFEGEIDSGIDEFHGVFPGKRGRFQDSEFGGCCPFRRRGDERWMFFLDFGFEKQEPFMTMDSGSSWIGCC